MTRIIVAMVLFLCGAVTTQAGAWQRDKGSGYASATIRLTWPKDIARQSDLAPTGQYYTLYLEYGLTDRITAGLDLGRAVSGATKAVAFAQVPLRDRDSGPKLAAALGLGTIDEHTVLRPGLSAGLGLASGWLSADSFAEVRVDTLDTDYKLDVTWGRNLARGRKLIVQLQTGAPHDEVAFARIAPSVVIPLRDKLMVEAGGAWGLTGDDSFGVLLGLWTEF